MSSTTHSQTDNDASPTLCFTFGEPEASLSSNPVDYLGTFLHYEFEYYEPPVSLTGLAKILRANAHHSSAAYNRRNMVVQHLEHNTLLSFADVRQWVFDYLLFGNAYLQRIQNPFGVTIQLKCLPAVYMRRMKAKNRYCMMLPGQSRPLDFKTDEVIHLKEYDPLQQIYGVPEYFAAVQSILLNEDSTLFRRKYYLNGAHMGYIFYMADGGLSEEDETTIKEQIKQSKGVGNFRSMFINIPGGDEHSVKIIPVGDIATKDEFERVKNITRNDVLAAWRSQGALSGVMAENTGGFGDIEKINKVHFYNEIEPLQRVFLQVNEYLPVNQQLKFRKPVFSGDGE